MRRFYLISLVSALAAVTAVHAQPGFTKSQEVLTVASNQNGSNVGDDLFNSYQDQLNRKAPSKKKAAPAKKTNVKPKPASKSKTDRVGVSKKPKVKTSKPATNMGVKKAQAPTSKADREEEMQRVSKDISNRIFNLNRKLSTKDISGVVRYITAMSAITKINNKATSKEAIESVLRNLNGVDTQKVMKDMRRMVDTQRGLHVLKMVRREVGTEEMAKSIEDVKNGGVQVKRAMSRMGNELQQYYKTARTQRAKNQIHKVMKMLNQHSLKNIPGKVMKASLGPLVVREKVLMPGKTIAQMLEATDDYEDGEDEETPGADIARSHQM